jgi:hypothetical protein
MHDDARRQRLAEDGLPPPEILDAWEVPEPSPDAIDRLFTAPPMERPMHAAPNNNRRSLLAPVAIGFFVAAALLLSFWIGRSSVEPLVIETPAPPPVIIGEPAVACACPEREPALPCPEPELEPAEPAPTPAPAVAPKRAVPRKRSAPTTPSTSQDLKNPFDSDGKEATLHIGTRSDAPGSATVFIDRRPRGMTPLTNVKVEPGHHIVEFRFANGKVVRERIKVEEGERRVIKAD